jgi:predicted transcriptional regulator
MLPPLGEVLKKRRMLGLSQKDLAKMAGVSQSLIAKVESGKIDPSYTKAKAVLDVLESQETRREGCVEQVLHDNVIGVQGNDPVSKAVQLMREHGFSQIPVFDGEHVVGSVTEKTVLGQILSGTDLASMSVLSVREIMDEIFPQVGENAPLSLVSNLLKVYPAVLVPRKGKTIAIVTKADLLKMLG